jgi:hypothetical protein
MSYLDFFIYVALVLPALLTGFFVVVIIGGILGWAFPFPPKKEDES